MSKFSISEIKILDITNCKSCEFNCLENNECIDCYSCQEISTIDNKILKLRLPGMGLIKTQNITMATSIFVLCQLATVSFDGIVETPFWVTVQIHIFSFVSLIGPNTVSNINTLGLILFPIIFIMLYSLFIWYIYLFHTPLGVGQILIYLSLGPHCIQFVLNMDLAKQSLSQDEID